MPRAKPKNSIYRGLRYVVKAHKAGSTFTIRLSQGSNSFGEVDLFAGERPCNGRKEFASLRGWPLYAIGVWLVGHGYTYEVCDG